MFYKHNIVAHRVPRDIQICVSVALVNLLTYPPIEGSPLIKTHCYLVIWDDDDEDDVRKIQPDISQLSTMWLNQCNGSPRRTGGNIHYS